MTDARNATGRRGEDLAAAFLSAKGFRILQQNWSCRLGEIDVIAERDGVVHFIEVKTRHTTTYGYPEEAITKTKLLHLRRAIYVWLQAQHLPPERYQADAIAILIKQGEKPEVEWIQNII